MSTEEYFSNRIEYLENRLNLLTQPYSQIDHSTPSGEVDLLELWHVIWGGKWIIITFTFIFTFFAGVYAFSLPNIYRSEALLAPVGESAGGGLARMAGQLGGLANLAGIDLSGGKGIDKTALALEVLKSRDFINDFIRRHDLLVTLMAVQKWDQATNTLIIDPNTYDIENKKWLRAPRAPHLTGAPSDQEAYRVFSGLLTVEQDKKSSFVSVAIEFYSPEIARQWVEWIVLDINSTIKQRDVLEAQRSIDYLNEQLKRTAIADMRSVFHGLIEEQTKTIMFSEAREEYVFKTVDRPIAPELKARPKKILYLIGGCVFGGTVALLFLLIRFFFRSNANKAATSE